METIHGLAELETIVGKELGPTDWFTVGQARVNGFADDTEDHQWIHVDLERALTGPFGGPVAHGFLTLSLIPYLMGGIRLGPGAGPSQDPAVRADDKLLEIPLDIAGAG